MRYEIRKYSEQFFAVFGSGVFPFDMLRYDNCTPAAEHPDSAKLDDGKFADHVRSIVWLRRLTLEPASPAFRGPTEDRWQSFGWIVLPGSVQATRPNDDDRNRATRTATEITTVHINGTSERYLIDQLCEARSAIHNAIKAVGETYPNGRDYYPQGPDAIGKAVDEHVARVQRLTDVYAELGAIAEAIVDRSER